jgi:hypothetical protein
VLYFVPIVGVFAAQGLIDYFGGSLQWQATADYPLRKRVGVIFYAITDAAVFPASASEEEIRVDKSAFSNLGTAAQGVISAKRVIPSNQ